jgi:AraC-like DNA-binding protein
MADLLFAGVLGEPRTSFPRHQHEHWELICYIQGSGVLTVGGQRIPFVPGTIVAQPPGIPHDEVAPGGYRCLFVGTRGPRLRGPIPVCQDDSHGSFRSACELLVRECWQRPSGWEAAGEDLTRLLWRLIDRWSGTADAVVRRAEALLLEHLADPELRIATIARRVGLSEEQLRRRFVAATGRSPRAELTRLRLAAAQQLLAHGTAVGETAAACGFADPFHFSKVFHHVTGRAPSAVSGEM